MSFSTHQTVSEEFKKPSWNRAVAETPELKRIASIPRRLWTEAEAEALAVEMTELLKTHKGTMQLRPFQAVALHDLCAHGGLVGLGRVGVGKCQPNSEPVLTPTGWKNLGDLKPGDLVVGSDGLPKEVLSVHPQGKREVYKLRFSDRTYALSDLEHLWTFSEHRPERTRKTRTLKQWLSTPLFRKGVTTKGTYKINRLYLPMTAPVAFEEKEYPLDPYTLGALLGDGGMSGRNISFTSMDADIVQRLKVPKNLIVKPTHSKTSGLATQYNITKGHKIGGPKENPLFKILNSLGLMGHTAHDKFIPKQYMLGSIEQRLELLRGLCDTDGYAVPSGGRTEFTSASERLAEDVAQVVESLGGTATRSYFPKKNRLLFSLPNHMNPFFTERKRSLMEARLKVRQRKNPTRTLKSVEYFGEEDCTCIRINSEDRLYHTRYNILTHNTLVSFLSPYVCESLRPLLVIPANLREKTRKDVYNYKAHWEISSMMAVESYEKLARSNYAYYLEVTKPDLIVFDEAHHLKNTKAAITRRVKRYLEACSVDRKAAEMDPSHVRTHPDPKIVLLSGTLANRSLKEYWHLLKWVLPRDHVPMPLELTELEMWCCALDEKVKDGNRVKPGALSLLYNEEEKELAANGKELAAARRAYGRRLVQTPGILSTTETFSGSRLTVDAIELTLPKNVQTAFKLLRDSWELPDGQPMSDGTMVAKAAKELALGFFYVWDPWPPDEWMKARREWFQFVRKVLAHNKRGLDTEEQVKLAVLDGLYPHEKLAAWIQIKDSFVPNVKPIWIDDFAVDAAADWAKKKKGIVWVHHTAFGKRLAQKTGIKYYGEGGFSEDGSFIEDHKPGTPLIASIKANKEGKNLQAWDKNLMTHPPSSGAWWEQTIGRTHRDGQQSDLVTFEMFASCIEHYQAFHKALGDAIYVQDSTPMAQKLLYAEVSIPSLEDAELHVGIEWQPQRADAT